MKNLWKYIVGAFTLILGMFFYERSKRQDSDAKLENAETNKQDAVLKQHTEDLKKQNEEDVKSAENLKNADTSQEDLLKFLNNTKDPINGKWTNKS